MVLSRVRRALTTIVLMVGSCFGARHIYHILRLRDLELSQVRSFCNRKLVEATNILPSCPLGEPSVWANQVVQKLA